ncbi:Arm DNA-binding domain-containing protein [Mariprofundus sp. EBB-1]|uniref:Arm DNA-binding domain-containing protein n=1 Tax=Mariprofundus sp. EBB-1 TaxID=2650971 RepID=UPI0012602777|nr:DUF3596 domain-containing protein [Mariprofundus sp. EBB-1]
MGAKIRGKSIQIDFTYRGKRCRETLKLEPTKANIKHAEGMHSTIMHEIAIGTFDYRNHFPESKSAALFGSGQSGTQLIKDALLAYLSAKKRILAPSTYASYESVIRHNLIPSFGELRLADLSTLAIRQWLGGLTVSNKRINNILIPLRGILDDAFADGAIDRNPMDRIKNLEVRQEDPEPFSLDEQERILAVLPDQGRNLIQFAFWTGLRTSELIALEWGDIDLVRGTAYVQRACVRGELKYPKTSAGKREVMLFPQALEALENQKQFSFKKGKQIFHNPETNKPWSSDVKVRHPLWTNAIKASGVRYRNPYQTRHTYASMLLSATANPAWIAKQMGHTNMNMVLRKYGRYMDDQNELESKKMFALMSQIGHKHTPETKKVPALTGTWNGGASGTRTPDTRIMIAIKPHKTHQIDTNRSESLLRKPITHNVFFVSGRNLSFHYA